MQDIRFVVIHRPGPRWDPGKPIFEQAGLAEHIAHYRQWLQQGKLMAGGPFLDGDPAAGMMIPVAGVPEEEITAFAAADPAVQSGLLKAEVLRWLVGMKTA
jgi:uncharacterized protein YciI